MTTLTATDARSNLFKLLQQTIKRHQPARIHSKAGTAILISEEDFESLMETAELMAVPGLLKSLKKADKEEKKGKLYTMDEVFGGKE